MVVKGSLAVDRKALIEEQLCRRVRCPLVDDGACVAAGGGRLAPVGLCMLGSCLGSRLLALILAPILARPLAAILAPHLGLFRARPLGLFCSKPPISSVCARPACRRSSIAQVMAHGYWGVPKTRALQVP
jgi:hypothetical protein